MAAPGYARASANGTLGGETCGTDDVVVKYTLAADANRDGDVDLAEVLV